MKRSILFSLFKLSVGAGLILAGWGCGSRQSASTPGGGGEVAKIELSSDAFLEGQPIPAQYTCSGTNNSPPLAWTGVPKEAQSLALIVDDPDAPGKTWVHWVLYNMEPGLAGLEEAASGQPNLGMEGSNDFRKTGYGGPCPPPGKPHRYFFKLYALDSTLNLKPGASKADLEKAMQGHILDQGQLIGTFKR